MVNFYALDPGGDTVLLVKVDAQGNVIYEVADEKASDENEQKVNALYCDEYPTLKGVFGPDRFTILNIPGYPNVVAASIRNIYQNNIQFNGYSKTCDINSNIIYFTQGKLLQIYSKFNLL